MKYLEFFFVFNLFTVCLSAQTVNRISSTLQEVWKQSTLSTIHSNVRSKDVDVIIYSDHKLQKIDGFGGCFNELGWEALQEVSPAAREKVMQDLFSKVGADFSICRMPIGASDYALSYYSLNDVAEDFGMRNFNIDRDRCILIPYIKLA